MEKVVPISCRLLLYICIYFHKMGKFVVFKMQLLSKPLLEIRTLCNCYYVACSKH